jgi:hypothetical protein
MGNRNSYRRHDPGPRSVGQPVNLCLVLGVLYESFIHPITILSELPAGAGFF